MIRIMMKQKIIVFLKKEEESIKGIISNGNANTINNKIEDEDDNTKNKENLKIDIANKIFKMLYCVEVECEKNYLFKKNWVYSFAFKSLPPLIQNKIKDNEKEEYIHFDTLLSTIVKILKEDKQIYAMLTHDELNVIIWRDLCKILEENRKLNEGKNKFIIKVKNNKNYENNKKEQFSNDNIEQKFQKQKNDNNDANDTLIKNCVVNSIIKIFNNELPIIWSDKQGNWIKVSSLPNEIKNKINILNKIQE